MALITCFDNVPDLVLIELFSYLSSIDILWGFTHLNHRLTTLITERGFFYHVNLSPARYHQFNRILHFLPLNDIQSLAFDSDASPLQLTCWPYLPCLRTLRIIGVYNHDDLLIFILLHAATITHLIIKSFERLVPYGHSINFIHPLGDLMILVHKTFLIHLPALRSLDLGLNYYWMDWPITVHVPLIYLRLPLTSITDLVRIMSSKQLCNTLRQLHVGIGNSDCQRYSTRPNFDSLIPMINLHTFTFFQRFFSKKRSEWTFIEMVTSSYVMPVLRRANLCLFININDIHRISSSSLFIDHRHVHAHFAFNLINCSQYIDMSQYIPHGNRFHPCKIVGAVFVVNHLSEQYERAANDDVFSCRLQYYHHMWYTLPWAFDEFFHEYLPNRWISTTRVFEISQEMTTIDQSSLRILDTSVENLSSSIYSLPHMASSNCIETYHLSYYTGPIRLDLSSLRNLTLVNSINCLNDCSSFATTLRSIRIHILCYSPNYMLPDWSAVLYSLSTLRQLSSLGIFMFDLPQTVDDNNCQIIAGIALKVTSFALCFRSRSGLSSHEDKKTFKDHIKFVKQLCHCILLLSHEKQPYYSIEDDGCGLIAWF